MRENKKMSKYILIVIALAISAASYRAGFVSAESKAIEQKQADLLEQQKYIENSFLEQIEKIKKESEINKKTAEALKNKPARIEREIITRVIENSGCDRLGVEYQRMYNKLVSSMPE